MARDEISNAVGFALIHLGLISSDEWVHLDFAGGTVLRRGRHGCVRHSAGIGVMFGRKHLAEGVIHPLNNPRAAAEIALETQHAQGQRAHKSLALHLQEKSNFSLAKTVNRLHWIADQKNRAPLRLLPSWNEFGPKAGGVPRWT